jgi:ketosteroid isomerase-like protein
MTISMRGAVDHPLVQKIIAYQGAMARQDFAEGTRIFASDVLYVVPGSNPLSGKYEGPEAVMGYFGRLMQITDGSYEISDMLWLTCEDRVTLVTRNHATIAGHKFAWDEAIVFEFIDGVKKRVDLYQAEQVAVDHFFAGADN